MVQTVFEIKTQEELELEKNVSLTHKEHLMNQISGYIDLAVKIEKNNPMGYIDKHTKILRIAAMVQRENMYGNQEV